MAVARRGAAMIPLLDCSPNARFPINGGLVQRRGGTARHDAVAWGFARGADARGVDIIQNCEVTGIRRDGARVVGVETDPRLHRGEEGRDRGGGQQTRVSRRWPGSGCPWNSHVLQAAVTEPLKPAIHTVVTSGRGARLHQPDRQGRNPDGGQPGLLQLLRAARETCRRWNTSSRVRSRSSPFLSRLSSCGPGAG